MCSRVYIMFLGFRFARPRMCFTTSRKYHRILYVLSVDKSLISQNNDDVNITLVTKYEKKKTKKEVQFIVLFRC